MAWYILGEDGRTPIEVGQGEWSREIERRYSMGDNDPWKVRRTLIPQPEGDPVLVSTVFLGIDHGYVSYPPAEKPVPILFETTIFNGPHDGYRDRCSTWEGAEAMHEIALIVANGKG